MSHIKRDYAKKKHGTAPGQLVYTGKESGWPPIYECWKYNKDSFLEEKTDSWKSETYNGVVWTNVFGVHNVSDIQTIVNSIKLDHLLAEDIVNVQQRPKIVSSDKILFASLKMIHYGGDSDELISENISLVLFDQQLICFQEKEGDVFDALRNRIRKGAGKIRTEGADYLFFTLLDVLTDHYNILLEDLTNSIDILEDDIFGEPNEEQLVSIYQIKKKLLQLRKAVIPLRDAVSKLIRSEDGHFNKSTVKYLHDVFDQLLSLSDSIESNRELNAGLKDLYLSSVSFKMNKVMQTLTILSVIFIPLTFVAGVYGMNLKNIPEMDWDYGYLYFWSITLILAISLAVYFKRKNWF